MQVTVRRNTAQNGGAAPVASSQPFLDPPDLFRADTPSEPLTWTCVRTRPRWEKKFAGWLREHRLAFYLPVVPSLTISGRKKRISDVPLFPGFVFVGGRHGKGDFDRTGIVVFVLNTQSPQQEAQLHGELWSVWCGLASGRYVSPVQNLAAGERCEIVSGPLQGLQARFERMGRDGRLVLQVEMMGAGMAVEAGADEIEVLG